VQNARLYGVVSLKDMLDFPCGDLYYISASLTNVVNYNDLMRSQEGTKELLESLERLSEHTKKLKLQLSWNASIEIRKSIAEQKTDIIQIGTMIAELQKRVVEELDTTKCFFIPKEKIEYLEPEWLYGTPLAIQFPSAWREIQRAGRCYAFGETTAVAFHLERGLEWGLKSLAVDLGKPFAKNSWDAHLKDIEKELTARYRAAGPRTPDEQFYSEAAAQFGHMKVAWRNPTMHIEAHYDDNQALYLIVTVTGFMKHLAERGLKETT